MNKKRMIGITLAPETIEWVQEFAWRNRSSTSAQIREWVLEKMDEIGPLAPLDLTKETSNEKQG